ncbi:MAG: homocitrate synthase family protein [Candidatus Nezhaarchaeales archaeon]|nr:MAG: homoaconitate hydratase [Candidatus Nezhaarchaeota archaeon WYZ-LMO8]TDA37373.1 MAG: homoaconitate hydratase [Candidatus Nezhaarchaeota archaeon WYZ-LMO7]
MEYREMSVSYYNFLPEVRVLMELPGDIIIHDTTLREGEQAAGVVYRPEDKLYIAKLLDEVGIQQIEAGFPAASRGEREALKMIVMEGLNAKIFGFARAVKSDIDAVADVGAYGVVMSFPPSDIQLKYKLKISREEYYDRAIELVEYAKSRGLYITFSAEDSTRADFNFMVKVFNGIIESGCDRVRIVDTLGCIHPTAMKFLIKSIRGSLKKKVPIEVHCHNDHGLAVANTLAAVEAGAEVLSTSILGLGERCGLAPTEEVIVALKNLYGLGSFKTEKLYKLCREVERITKLTLPPHKPVVGINAFAHASGIHQHAILENPICYEPYPPEMVGQARRIVIGKLSGRHAIKAKLAELGIEATDEEVLKITDLVKSVSEERKSPLSDEEFMNLVRAVKENSVNQLTSRSP